jgi:hypothetical protein
MRLRGLRESGRAPAGRHSGFYNLVRNGIRFHRLDAILTVNASRWFTLAFAMLLTVHADGGARCENWKTRPHVAVSVNSEVYVVSTGDDLLCVDRWQPASGLFTQWFVAPEAVRGSISAVEFRSPEDIEILATERLGVYSLSLLHLGSIAGESSLRHLWMCDIGDLTTAAHWLGFSRWFLPTSSGGTVIEDGSIKCAIATHFAQGPPTASATNAERVAVVVAGRSLWRYRPTCDASSDAGSRRVFVNLRSVVAAQKGWLAVAGDGLHSAIYILDDALRFVTKVDVNVRGTEIELIQNGDRAIASVPSLGVAYTYDANGLSKMGVRRGFTACRSWAATPIQFCDGATVELPTPLSPAESIDIHDITIAGTTFGVSKRDVLVISFIMVVLMVATAILLLRRYHRVGTGRIGH